MNIQKDSGASISNQILQFFLLNNICVRYICMRGGEAFADKHVLYV